MPDSPASTAPAPAPAKSGRGGLLAGLVVGVVALAGAYGWWRYNDFYPSTDDASLQAHFTWVAPQVTGQVVEKDVEPNQYVKAGAPLFKIDPRPFQQRLTEAQANAALVAQNITADLQQIASDADLIAQQQALIQITQKDYDDLKPLLVQELAAQIKGDTLADTLAAQKAKLASLQAQQAEDTIRLGSPAVQEARRQQAAAQVALAQLNLDWTNVTAPADGWVTQFDLRVGDVVMAAQPLFPFVEDGHWWIDANFKETHLDRVEVGQPVTFTVDMYPGQVFHGTVHSLSRGVAASFSLLPPQNTTGNWVKVTQRVPVRILVEEDAKFPYRLGASVTARVDTVPAGK